MNMQVNAIYKNKLKMSAYDIYNALMCPNSKHEDFYQHR